MGPVVLATCRTPPLEPDDDPRLAAALRKAGCEVLIRPWTDIDPGAAQAAACVILRSTWDYHLHTDAFLAWLDALERAEVTVLNPSSLVRLGMDKSYLTIDRPFGCLAPVTVSVASDADAILNEVRARSWQRFVIKPPVSASAERTFLLSADDESALRAALRHQPAQILLQEYLPEIREGELSLIFFEGWFSHAVRKIPAEGEFRVQSEFGSRIEPFHPHAPVIAAARQALLHLPEMPCYARVDGLVREGNFVLMELELIEPELFLRHSPSADEVFANAIVARLAPGEPAAGATSRPGPPQTPG